MENKVLDVLNVHELIQNKDVFFFGGGRLCRSYLNLLAKYNVKGIFDNDLTKTRKTIGNVQVIDPKILETLDVNKTIFVVTVVDCEKIKLQLENYGFKFVFSLFELLFNSKKLEKLKFFLSDIKSINIVDKIIFYRLNGCKNYKDICQDGQYFPNDIPRYSFGIKEVFVDAGAYDGDTIANFKLATKNNFEQIYALEPDEINYKKLCCNVAGDSRIKSFLCGAWDKEELISYASDGTTGSHIAQDGDVTVKVQPIDSLLDTSASFIKMDIEGAELKALMGAKNTIQKYKPKLAICIYHNPDDLWEIPLYIKSIVPEYELYIRHHSDDRSETVLYALIP